MPCATLGGVDISARTEYAVRAMLALAQAQAMDAGPISVETRPAAALSVTASDRSTRATSRGKSA